MSEHTNVPRLDDRWPAADPEGRAVRFTERRALADPRELHPTLRGPSVTLVPMEAAHAEALARIGLDRSIWRYMPVNVSTPAEMERFVLDALGAHQNGSAIPFVTLLREEREEIVVGTSRFLNIDRTHRRLEIGATWIAPRWQRTNVNTEAKYLMLRYAFEELGALRVELKTDSLNERSRAAIARIGAVQEGILRDDVITSDGRIRNSVYFGIVADEWPAVRRRLEAMLER